MLPSFVLCFTSAILEKTLLGEPDEPAMGKRGRGREREKGRGSNPSLPPLPLFPI
jgi:hypothetical protein